MKTKASLAGPHFSPGHETIAQRDRHPGEKRRLDHILCVAPMMGCTDRHGRYLMRLLSGHVYLYSEMVTCGALLHSDAERLLKFDAVEHPVALQLGGSDPDDMAACARLAADRGYDEVNINVGCPSNRVQSGRFGACLMHDPQRVADCVGAMVREVNIPVTVKTRIGVDHRDDYESLAGFIEIVSAAGCSTFIVHARKAWLNGLNPRQNRSVPPLNYPFVYQLKIDYPELEIVLNGGVQTLEAARPHMGKVDGVMIGRAAWNNPWLLASVDRDFFSTRGNVPGRMSIATQYLHYMERELAHGVPLARLARPLTGLFQGIRGARAWRRNMCEKVHQPQAGMDLILRALDQIRAQQAGEPA